MERIYEQSFVVGPRETDLFNHCRPSGILDYLQQAATSHAITLGWGRDMLVEQGAIWMLVRLKYTLLRPILGEELVTVRTWHRGAKGATVYRDFDLFVDGQRVGEAISSWVVADVNTHSLLRPNKVLAAKHRPARPASPQRHSWQTPAKSPYAHVQSPTPQPGSR